MLVTDCEMTGLEPTLHSILSVGAIDLDNPSHQLYEECRAWDGAKIEDEALAVNGFTREQAGDPAKQSEAELVHKFIAFANGMPDTTLAGQNVFVDYFFLEAAARRAGHTAWPFAHRIIDIHTLAWEHMVKRGVTPPVNAERRHSALNLEAVARYCGMEEEPKPHNALVGAKYSAEVISRLLYDKKLLPEFEQYDLPWIQRS
ncbi:MAG TPA: exonuclease domain-containing protein [Candidatus Paceibacterota bacterium]|jgi:DNA polymerase-3 subunit epsilon|nr:exonuclease domain-containing protein [Candidatus Paceibacterota bacterium]